MTTSLVLLRAVQMGLSVADLNLVTLGTVLDMMAERSRDYDKEDSSVRDATQADFDRF